MSGPEPTPPQSASTTLSELLFVTRMLGVPSWPPLTLVALGFATAVLEALAVALVVSMLFALLSQPITNGPIGALQDFIGGSWTALAVSVVALVAFKSALAHLYVVLSVRYKNAINARVLTATHARLVDMPYAALRARGQGDLLNTSATDTWQVANAAYLLTRLAINFCMIAVFSAIILMLAWQIALMAALGGALLALIGQGIAKTARDHGLKLRRDVEAYYTRLLAAVHGARLVRAFAHERTEKTRVERQVEQLRSNSVRAESARALAAPLNEVGYLALLVAMIALAGAFNVAQAATFTAIALLYRLAPQIREVEGNRLAFATLYAPLKAVRELIADHDDRRTPVCEPFAGPAAPIRFESVTFQPAGAAEPVLDNISFEIPAGQTTVLLGPSGAGKTSIINLLLRLYEPNSGAISVGGRRLRSIDRVTWLGLVAAAGQDLDLIEGTIAENLRLGAPDADDAQLRAAATDAGAHAFIDNLPDGYNTWIGSFGYNLSGGQRQRLSLARALLRRPQLLLLDESTSAIESALEADILQSLTSRRAGLTVVLITHRLNRAAQVDHVIRLERGEVVAEEPAGAYRNHLQIDGRSA